MDFLFLCGLSHSFGFFVMEKQTEVLEIVLQSSSFGEILKEDYS